jgi:hypothetical protein
VSRDTAVAKLAPKSKIIAEHRGIDPDIVVFTETHYDPQAPMKVKPDGMAPYQRFKNRYAVSAETGKFRMRKPILSTT